MRCIRILAQIIAIVTGRSRRYILERLSQVPDIVHRENAKLGIDSGIVLYEEFSDGCRHIEYEDSGTRDAGPRHAPHRKFEPDDIPVRVWKRDNRE